MKQYLDLLRYVLNNGIEKQDRTGTGTISVFGYQMRFDLSKGFPLVTTKNIPFKSVVGELLWMFCQGSTNNKDLNNMGVSIWNEWQNDYGELPYIYGKQIVSREGDKRVVKIDRRVVKFIPFEYNTVEHNYASYNDRHEFIILKTYHANDRKLCDIQFVETGSIREGVRFDQLHSVKDLYKPSVWGIGFLGENNINSGDNKKVYSIWQSMLERCYNPNHPQYENYGGRGVFVQGEWHCFKNFVNDIKHLPNWQEKRNNWNGYNLDKDYYDSNCYSVDTCIWLKKQEQQIYRKNNKPFRVIYPNGTEKIFIEREKCCEDIGIHKSSLERVLIGKRKKISKFEEFKFEFIEDGNLYRYKLPINQLQVLINNIKSNPNSRRLIIDNWNPWDIDRQALPACHSFVQFYVANNKLSCQLYQRSADVFLGVPFNIASYSLLTQMIAHECGLELGEFIHTFGDVHIYKNHIEQVKLQLTREPFELPHVTLNPEVKSVFDFTMGDIILHDYNHHPTIKGDVSV